MNASRLRRTLAAFAALALASSASADDKDLLKKRSVPPNIMIVFGNSQTTEQPLNGTTSMWDGDADSPSSKMGAAKRVIKSFVQQKQGQFNIGMTTFAHNPNAGSITIYRKHWLYAPTVVDFPNDTFREPVGTIERWGDNGEGPCTNLTVPSCTASSPSITLGAQGSVAGPFFGSKHAGTAYVYVSNSARVAITWLEGDYGDAYADGTLATYLRGTYAVRVTKTYQEKSGVNWNTKATPGGSPNPVTVTYVPAPTLTADLFYTAAPDAGKEIGFLNDAKTDFDVNANCSGWEFQVNSAPLPLIRVPRDYKWGAACNPPQNSYPCVTRLLRPQGVLVAYNGSASGTYTTTYDHDNPGYYGAGGKYADGCDSTLLGAVDAGLDIAQNQAILTTRNGSQAPIKNLLSNILDYFTKPAIDGFSRGKRTDDPDAACRTSGVILIYDNFNGCQNDSCAFLTGQYLSTFKSNNIPIYVIGLGVSATATSNTGICIAHNSGAILPDGSDGYFPVTSPEGLYKALSDISSFLTEATKDFASASISSVQAGGDQMAYLATFNATQNRSVWNGRINGYTIRPDGSIPSGTKTINDPNDPLNGVAIPVPSNDPSILKWNTGANLQATPGTGATVASAVLAPGAALSTSSYNDSSTDLVTTIPTYYYPGRKIVWSLPQGYAAANPAGPATLPIPPGAAVPETRYDLTATTGASWWPTLKALLGPQTNPPSVLAPALTDTDASNSLRFIWGDRDAVMGAAITEANQKYLGLKLGDVFHSNPSLVGTPGNYSYYVSNLNGYADFVTKYKHRRRVLYAGANDGLLHAFDIGAWDRNTAVCQTLSTGATADCYDLGTGTELFAFAPRAIMQIYKPLKDAVDAQTKRDEWTVDGSPAAADVYIDPSHNGTPAAGNRQWQTVLVGGMREGSPFEGTAGTSPAGSYGSYYALNVTQPDELVTSGSPPVTTIANGGFTAPACLNASGDATCARDWPTVMWELSDGGDADAAGTTGAGYPDMGETWSRPGLGRVRVCTSSCGTASASYVDKYVAIFGGGFDRERKNRRGNWIYVVDIETGSVLLRANSSCGVNAAAGCTPTYMGAIPAEPAVMDFNGDGIIDALYFSDNKGQLWRVDTTDLRYPSSIPAGRFANKIDYSAGSARPFLLFQAPQGVSNQFYPAYFRPSIIFLASNTTGAPTVGVAFGTGDRDDIIAAVDPISLTYPQRFYYVVDDHANITRTETDLTMIASPSAPNVASVSPKGWGLKLNNGERVITDTLTIQGVINFGTYTPGATGSSSNACSNPVRCGQAGGFAAFYSVDYATGNAVGTTRGEVVPNAQFITNPIFFTSADNTSHIVFTTSSGSFTPPKFTPKSYSAIKEWKEH